MKSTGAALCAGTRLSLADRPFTFKVPVRCQARPRCSHITASGTQFRPCIDIHDVSGRVLVGILCSIVIVSTGLLTNPPCIRLQGSVKQIVGSSLKDGEG